MSESGISSDSRKNHPLRTEGWERELFTRLPALLHTSFTNFENGKLCKVVCYV